MGFNPRLEIPNAPGFPAATAEKPRGKSKILKLNQAPGHCNAENVSISSFLVFVGASIFK